MGTEDGPLLPGGRRPAESWQSLVDRKIEEARREGAFDNLPGEGKPLDLENHPLEDPAWRLAATMLKGGSFSHPALEWKRSIQEDHERLRRELVRGLRGSAPVADRAVAAFREKLVAVNGRVRDHNLAWPALAPGFWPYDADSEIASAKQEAGR